MQLNGTWFWYAICLFEWTTSHPAVVVVPTIRTFGLMVWLHASYISTWLASIWTGRMEPSSLLPQPHGYVRPHMDHRNVLYKCTYNVQILPWWCCINQKTTKNPIKFQNKTWWNFHFACDVPYRNGLLCCSSISRKWCTLFHFTLCERDAIFSEEQRRRDCQR